MNAAQLADLHPKFLVETCSPSTYSGWVWRVRMQDGTKCGDTFLAVGTNAPSEDAARKIAEAVAVAMQNLYEQGEIK